MSCLCFVSFVPGVAAGAVGLDFFLTKTPFNAFFGSFFAGAAVGFALGGALLLLIAVVAAPIGGGLFAAVSRAATALDAR